MSGPAQILDGRAVAQKLTAGLRTEIEALRKKNISLTLATLRIGDEKDAVLYSKAIQAFAEKLGILFLSSVLPAEASMQAVEVELKKWNADPRVTGVLIFSPLPKHLNLAELLGCVHPDKNLEGRLWPPTALAVMRLIEETGVGLEGLEAVVVGRSQVVGKPVALLLLQKNATVTVCHSRTKNLEAHVRRADVLVVAVGRKEFIKGSWIKKGAIVIDAGENVADGKLVGDVEFEAARKKALFISPVPGGVGPLTNVMLFSNLLQLIKKDQ